jgi:fructose-1,6-bisphosphatase/inositol monophosphatase family enzyme
VTAIDLESQRVIESAVMEAFPGHGFLGEESVEAGHCASIGKLIVFRYLYQCLAYIC